MNKRDKIKKHDFVVTIIVVLFSCTVGPQLVSCQKKTAAAAAAGGGGGAGGSGGGSGAGLEDIFAKELYRGMSSYTNVFKAAIKKELGYCILDV
jgi:hypothetical protein